MNILQPEIYLQKRNLRHNESSNDGGDEYCMRRYITTLENPERWIEIFPELFNEDGSINWVRINNVDSPIW